jgi:small conductance mechanosensitive channel
VSEAHVWLSAPIPTLTITDNYRQVYFDTNRMIVDVLGGAGFPVPRIPVAMADNSSN